MLCHAAELLLWFTHTGSKTFIGEKSNSFAFRLEWGWKSRLGCHYLIYIIHSNLGLQAGFQFSFIWDTFCVIITSSQLLFTYSLFLAATCKTDNTHTQCQVHLTAHNFLIADRVLVSLPGWMSVTLTIPHLLYGRTNWGMLLGNDFLHNHADCLLGVFNWEAEAVMVSGLRQVRRWICQSMHYKMEFLK